MILEPFGDTICQHVSPVVRRLEIMVSREEEQSLVLGRELVVDRMGVHGKDPDVPGAGFGLARRPPKEPLTIRDRRGPVRAVRRTTRPCALSVWIS